MGIFVQEYEDYINELKEEIKRLKALLKKESEVLSE